MKRLIRDLLLVALLMVPHIAYTQTKFLLGYSSFSSNQTPLWVAKEEGLYKRYGNDSHLILIEAKAAPAAPRL